MKVTPTLVLLLMPKLYTFAVGVIFPQISTLLALTGIQTQFLRPAIFTLYSTESKAELMRNYRLKPDTKGNIHVYLPFTSIENMSENTATHPLLTYADLLNSGEPRNFEVAQKIYENHVKILF